MNYNSTLIISIVVSVSLLMWLVSIWQYDAMMISMMTFYYNPSALSLFVAIWTAGMAAMMFPAIVPMILIYNRLIGTNDNVTDNIGNNNNQIIYQKSDNGREGKDHNNDIRHSIREEKAQGKHNVIDSLKYKLKIKSSNIILFVSAYLAIWALTGIILLVGWSFLFDTLLFQLGLKDSHQQQQQQQLLSIGTVFGIILIMSGIYQFSSLKTRCLGYCESPMSFFMRRWRRGNIGALKMGMYHGLYCLGCCWPYFLLMVALGWMNVLWMALFAAIIFAEKVWTKGGLWIARITGTGFIILGILSLTGIVTLPTDSMDSVDSDDMMSMNMDMSSTSPDNMVSNDTVPSSTVEQGDMKNMIMR